MQLKVRHTEREKTEMTMPSFSGHVTACFVLFDSLYIIVRSFT